VLAPTGFWAVYHFLRAGKTIVQDQQSAAGYTHVRPGASAIIGKAMERVP
jgi:hypothetical protein